VTVLEPSDEQVREFCSRDPVERVFLEDIARRGLGRFAAVERDDGRLAALCHSGANLVPSGEGCAAFAELAAHARARMIIGEARAVSDLWEAARRRLPAPRADRPHQPVYTIAEPPEPGHTALRAATFADVDLLLPACAAAHELELGVDPLARDADGFRWRTEAQIAEGRSWMWVEGGAVRFKCEASAWTPRAVQLQQVWVDPSVRRRGYGARGMRDVCRLLLETTPTVTLFVRSENTPAIATYESIGMRKTLEYRSVLF
jgi:predicted GNAT family acetyltransferase